MDRPIYLISGEQAKDFLSASKVAETFKAHGYVVSIIEAGMKSFPDNVRRNFGTYSQRSSVAPKTPKKPLCHLPFSLADIQKLQLRVFLVILPPQGFLYYLDADAEDARLAAVAAAKAAAAAAAQKR